ncbi:hypothetical protein ACFLT9_12955 [Acidobacteriota bacterium]
MKYIEKRSGFLVVLMITLCLIGGSINLFPTVISRSLEAESNLHIQSSPPINTKAPEQPQQLLQEALLLKDDKEFAARFLPAADELPNLLQAWEYVSEFTAILRIDNKADDGSTFPKGRKVQIPVSPGTEKWKEKEVTQLIDYVTYKIFITIHKSKIDAADVLQKWNHAKKQNAVSLGDGGFFAKIGGTEFIYGGPAVNQKDRFIHFYSGSNTVLIHQYSKTAIHPAKLEELEQVIDEDVMKLAQAIATKIKTTTGIEDHQVL